MSLISTVRRWDDHTLTSELARICGEILMEAFENSQAPAVRTLQAIIREMRRRRDFNGSGWCTCAECDSYLDVPDSFVERI